MGGQKPLIGPGLPDVEIVHLRHIVERQQVVPDLDEINAGRDGIEEGIDRLPDDPDDSADDDDDR